MVDSIQDDLIDTQMEIMDKSAKYITKLKKGIYNPEYIKRVLCSPITIPIGIINNLVPIPICQEKIEETNEDIVRVKQKGILLDTVSNPKPSVSLLNKKKDCDKDKDMSEDLRKLCTENKKDKRKEIDFKSIQKAAINSITKLIQERTGKDTITINTEQIGIMELGKEVLDENPFLKEMAEIKQKNGIWKPAMVDLINCSNGEEIEKVEGGCCSEGCNSITLRGDKLSKEEKKEFDKQTDMMDELIQKEDVDELVSKLVSGEIESTSDVDMQKSKDQGGYNVTYYDGTKESGIPLENIRFSFGCAPTVDQKATITVKKITGDIQKLTNDINTEITIMNKQTAELHGCPSNQYKTKMKGKNEAEAKREVYIKQMIHQANKQTINALQKLTYTDYFGICDKGKRRKMEQKIDAKVLSKNIVNMAIETSMDNKVILKHKQKNVQLYYKPNTPRMFVLSVILNIIILYISISLIIKLLSKYL